MSAGRIIAYIASAILIFFGVMFILAAFNEEYSFAKQMNYLLPGLIIVAIGFGLIWLVTRRARAAANAQNVTLKVDLPANVNLDTLKCQSCGGALTADNIKMVAGAPVVTCPYCNTTYQLTEEPKW